MLEIGTSGNPLVDVRGACKRFGATQALDDVSLDIRAGEVVALLGQNGAGKSTVIKVLAGVHGLDAGEVTIGGHALGSAAAAGRISFIHQDLGLVAGLTVAENIALGTGYPRQRGLISWRHTRLQAERALARVSSNIDPNASLTTLGRTERSLVAIARALVVDADVLVLDEPTASLPVQETGRLFSVLRDLRDRGLGLLYVSHRLDEVFDISDRMVIMRDGRVVAESRTTDSTPSQVVLDIVGRKPIPPPPPAPLAEAPTVLTVTGLVSERVGPIDLTLRAGEVLGLVGLGGAGHVELGRALVGALPVYAGQIVLGGRPHTPRGVAAAVGLGMGFITSNRAEEGLAPDLTVRENLLPNPALRGLRALRLRSHGPERALADTMVATYGVRPTDAELPVVSLSGGNQQKVILGRWLSTGATVLVLEEPTAGVDVGAKHELYNLLDEALERGVAVLLISTDVEEVAAVSHRGLVFKDGRVVRELLRSEMTVEALVSYASGAAA